LTQLSCLFPPYALIRAPKGNHAVSKVFGRSYDD
jgi:hypothetical protein